MSNVHFHSLFLFIFLICFFMFFFFLFIFCLFFAVIYEMIFVSFVRTVHYWIYLSSVRVHFKQRDIATTHNHMTPKQIEMDCAKTKKKMKENI